MYTPTTNHPSFSASLLDQIYRSIDESNQYHHNSTLLYTNKHNNFSINQYFPNNHTDYETNSTSSSSSSSNRGVFSSSDTESNYVVSSKPKPIRTYTNRTEERTNINDHMTQMYGFEDVNVKQKHEGKFVKTKSRALKMYTDLKKMKHPISPGAKVTTFLNSIFTTKNTKVASDVNLQSNSSCSSASSFSRSCLRKPPSPFRGKSGNNDHKSVRSVSVRDESNLHEVKFVKNHNNDEIKARLSEKTCSIEVSSRNYQKKVECEIDLIEGYNDDDDDDDDNVSIASSDLFELENFSAIGTGNYEDELPVFETTHLNKSLALGNGF